MHGGPPLVLTLTRFSTTSTHAQPLSQVNVRRMANIGVCYLAVPLMAGNVRPHTLFPFLTTCRPEMYDKELVNDGRESVLLSPDLLRAHPLAAELRHRPRGSTGSGGCSLLQPPPDEPEHLPQQNQGGGRQVPQVRAQSDLPHPRPFVTYLQPHMCSSMRRSGSPFQGSLTCTHCPYCTPSD